MKTVRLYAYLQNNLGDDLMVKILLERYKNCRFFFDFSNVSNKTLMEHKNFIHHEKLYTKYARVNNLLNKLPFVKTKNLVYNKVFDNIKSKCCGSVYIGGSVFYSRSSETPQEHIAKERKRINPAPLYVIGANFNPKESREYIEAYSDFFASLGGVSFRDHASYKTFENLSNVQYAPDVVFNLDVKDLNNSDKNNTVVISVVNCNNKANKQQYTDSYETAIARSCEEIVQAGLIPVLMSFCKVEGDEAAIERICKKLPTTVAEKIQKYFYSGDIDEALTVFAKAEYVIATRFHAMILALVLHIPFFAISYDEKIEQVMNDIGLDCYCDISLPPPRKICLVA